MNISENQLSKSELIQNFIGPHVNSVEFQFQEKMRKMDLAIRDILTNLNEDMGKSLFTKGWGQIIAAIYLIHSDDENLKLSETFQKYVIGHTHKALESCDTPNTALQMNVRGPSKNILMYPHAGKYFDWKEAGVSKRFSDALNEFLGEVKPNYSHSEGKLYLNLDAGNSETTIFQRLWATDFKEELERLGFKRMKSNNEHPHITLINSDVLASLKAAFEKKYGVKGSAEFDSFMNELVHHLNAGRKTNFHACEFGGFLSTYSEDYPPFEFCAVAQFKAPYVERDLTFIVEKVKKELDFDLKVTPKSSFHMTLGVEYREPASWPKNIEDLRVMLAQDNPLMKTISTLLRDRLVVSHEMS